MKRYLPRAQWLFLMIGWNLIKYGIDLRQSGEVSHTLTLPFYPVAYGLGISFFVQCLVLVCDILKIFGGRSAGMDEEAGNRWFPSRHSKTLEAGQQTRRAPYWSPGEHSLKGILLMWPSKCSRMR